MRAASIVIAVNTAHSEALRIRLTASGVVVSEVFDYTHAFTHLKSNAVNSDILFYHGENDVAKDTLAVSKLCEISTLPIVVVGQMSDPRYVVDLVRAGAFDCIDSSDRFEQEIEACIVRLKRDMPEKQSGKVISVISPAGGCGASTVAVNLGVALSSSPYKSCLLELDPFMGTASLLLDLEPQHLIQDVYDHSDHMDEEMLEKVFAHHKSGLKLLSSRSNERRQFKLDLKTSAKLLWWTAQSNSHVLVDCPPPHHSEYINILRFSDMIIIVLRLEFPCLVQCRSLMIQLQKAGIAEDRILLVANRCNRKVDLEAQQVKQALGRNVDFSLPDDSIASLACNIGNPIVSEFIGSKLGQSLSKLAKQIT
ncbi:AAA family ATPase [Aureliella helgolandensis]|uniref:Sporulation initiation inhibitor protein Soj n=1 Tax=Aureliella helgolandensis TaxID=2527968 RepID=A0A518G3Y1_9BACT|nr:AAA family ATPase [Aureliella helgolandensis]QDV23304.1 Sporulation initiation inhibitor protein Soj [Aureliella helgolandensis]